MSPWSRLLTESHRRRLWQVLGMYLFASWVGFQVVLALVQGIGLPEWLPRLAALLFLVGLPVVLLTALVQGGLRSRTEPRTQLDPTLFPDMQDPPAGDVVAPASPANAARVPGPATLALRQLLTWRRALLAGAAAFALLGLVTAGWLALRALGIGPMASLVAAEELERDARVLIADFTARNADTTLAAVVTEAFRIDFARSTLLRSVEPSEVRGVLQRMGITELPRIDAELARQVALRDGISAYVTGEVTGAGAGYVLTAKLMATESGDVLAAFRERAKDEDAVIEAVDRLSKSLRERSGESLRTLRRAQPLAQVTTSSLEALQYYTQGLRASSWEGNPQRSMELHEEAVRADSTFAMAHAAIAVNYFNRGDAELGMAAAERALRFSERLGEFERARIEATYHLARRDYPESVRALQRALAIDSLNHASLNNIALAFDQMGDTARARDYFERAVRADTTRFFAYTNLGEHLVLEGRFEEAERALEQAVARAPRAPWPNFSLAQLPHVAGNSAEAERRLTRLIEDPSMPPGTKDAAESRYVQLLKVGGRWQEASRRSLARASANEGREAAAAWQLIERVMADLLVFRQPERAAAKLPELRTIAAVVEDTDQAAWLAVSCALVGDVRCGQQALARTGVGDSVKPWTSVPIRAAQGLLASARGDRMSALTIFRGDDYGCKHCFEPLVARTFIQLQQPDSAAAVYERFVRSTSMDRIWVEDELAPIHEWLADYYDQRGDRAAAARHYARFIEIWQQADPELQPRVASARERLQQLQPDR